MFVITVSGGSGTGIMYTVLNQLQDHIDVWRRTNILQQILVSLQYEADTWLEVYSPYKYFSYVVDFYMLNILYIV